MLNTKFFPRGSISHLFLPLDEYFKDRRHFREKNSLSFKPLFRVSITI